MRVFQRNFVSVIHSAEKYHTFDPWSPENGSIKQAQNSVAFDIEQLKREETRQQRKLEVAKARLKLALQESMIEEAD